MPETHAAFSGLQLISTLGKMISELTELIGCDMESPALLDYLNSLPYDCVFNDSIYFDSLISKENGLEISFSKRGRVSSIYFYSGSQAGFSRYPLALPHFLLFEMSRNDVIELYGQPSVSGGPREDYLGKHIIYWDRWDYNAWQIHLTYPEDRAAIQLLNIMSIEESRI